MQLINRITELCLVGETRPLPFAVLVECNNECAWAIATDYYDNANWASHVLSKKERSYSESWLLASWADWLADIATETSEARHKALMHLEQSSPGIIVRKPRLAHTELPAAVVAASWQRRRLHDRAETIAANIAHRLAGTKGMAHWASALYILEQSPLKPDWIVERTQQFTRSTDVDPSRLSIIQVIDAGDVSQAKSYWADLKGFVLPYTVAVVRGIKAVEVLDNGCFIGDRFRAAESLAVSIVRSKWMNTPSYSS